MNRPVSIRLGNVGLGLGTPFVETDRDPISGLGGFRAAMMIAASVHRHRGVKRGFGGITAASADAATLEHDD